MSKSTIASPGDFVDSYLRWLREHLHVSAAAEGAIVISTPFLDRHHDELEIFVEREGDRLLLSDDGYTLRDLRHAGIDLSKGARREHLVRILANHGVALEGDELQIRTDERGFAKHKHAMIQAMLAVDGLHVTARETVAKFFKEDVEEFLRAQGAPIFPDANLPGRSGFEHHFDALLPRGLTHPDRVIKAVATLDTDRAKALCFAIDDARKVRSTPLEVLAYLDDREKKPTQEVLAALRQYQVKPILWSERTAHLAEISMN